MANKKPIYVEPNNYFEPKTTTKPKTTRKRFVPARQNG